MWGCGGANTLFYTLRTHPKPLPTLSQHLFPAPPHSPDMSLHTFPHSPPHTLSHFPTPLTPFLHLPQHFPTLTPHTSSQPPRLLQHFPMLPMLYHLPHAKISHFSYLLPN